MEYTALFIAIDLIKNTDVEHPVVDDKEKYRPLDERYIETFDAFLDKSGLVVEIFRREEIACGDEEKGHVELEDEPAQPTWCLSMGYHHQDDGNALGDGYGGIALHDLSRL